MLLSDQTLIDLCTNGKDMISPFVQEQITRSQDERLISYGLSSYGYDIRVADTYKIFTNINSVVSDPKEINSDHFVEHKGRTCIIPPNGFALAHSIEHFNIPEDVTALCLSKSTYARIGLTVNSTVLEAGWQGQLTLELTNPTPLPMRIYSYEGIAQLLFFKGDRPPNVSYKDRAGKYMGQEGITLPRLK